MQVTGLKLLVTVWGLYCIGSVISHDQPFSKISIHETVFAVNDAAYVKASPSVLGLKGNGVSTTKYNLFSFLPKGLYEQFRRVANLYFLTISCLSFTPVSPVSPITNVVPLSIVLFVSLVKEAFEDWKRLQNDMTINNSPIDLLIDQRWESVPWKRLQVGDIIRLYRLCRPIMTKPKPAPPKPATPKAPASPAPAQSGEQPSQRSENATSPSPSPNADNENSDGPSAMETENPESTA